MSVKIGVDQSWSSGCAEEINLGLRDVRKRHRMRDASHLVMSEGRRMQFNDVRGGVAVGCSCLLCEGRRTQVDVRTYVFQTRVVF